MNHQCYQYYQYIIDWSIDQYFTDQVQSMIHVVSLIIFGTYIIEVQVVFLFTDEL